MLETEFHEFSHLVTSGSQLVRLMFGQTSASLRQLATRTIFHQCFIKQKTCVSDLLASEVLKRSLTEESNPHTYEEYIHLILNRTVLQMLIAKLGLPRDFLFNFEVELLLHRIANKMADLKPMPPENIFHDSDGSLSDYSDSESAQFSEEGGDSDLEYW